MGLEVTSGAYRTFLDLESLTYRSNSCNGQDYFCIVSLLHVFILLELIGNRGHKVHHQSNP